VLVLWANGVGDRPIEAADVEHCVVVAPVKGDFLDWLAGSHNSKALGGRVVHIDEAAYRGVADLGKLDDLAVDGYAEYLEGLGLFVDHDIDGGSGRLHQVEWPRDGLIEIVGGREQPGSDAVLDESSLAILSVDRYHEERDGLALELSDKILAGVLAKLDEKLASAIDARLTEIKYPKLIEEVKVTEVPITVDKPVYVDVEVSRPIYVDKEIINPITKDVEVINAVIIDKPVINCIVEDIRVTNCIVKDVEVDRAVIREKTIDVVHKNCFDPKGNPLV